MDENVERRIRERAYAIWQEEGSPPDRDVEHWLRAAQEIAAMEGVNAASPAAQGHEGPEAAAAATKTAKRPRATAAGSPAARSATKSTKTATAKNEGAATKGRKKKTDE